MTGRAGESVRLLGGRVAFWMASSLIFAANALFSLLGDRRELGVLQLMTAVLAVLSAVEAWDARRTGAAGAHPASGTDDARRAPSV